MKNPSKKWLYRQYIDREISIHELSKLIRISVFIIGSWLRFYKIPIRSLKEAHSTERRRLKASHRKGNKNGNWRGGQIVRPARKGRPAYLIIYKPNDPGAHAINGKYIEEHRLIAETILLRPLRPEEVVHHINGNSLDNRRNNLLICSRSYHSWLHCRLRKLSSQHKNKPGNQIGQSK